MKQLLQAMGSGKLEVAEVAEPTLQPEGVLVRNRASLVSAGTERMLMEFAGKSLAGKALDRPDLVRKVLDKARNEGVLTAFDATRRRLEEPFAPGYSSAGTVMAVGNRARGVRVGDRVACAGGGYAMHAEVVYVPRTLCVAVPDGVSDVEAAFGAVGAVAVQGVRQAEVALGERVAVIGLGLIGLLSVQLLKAAGCRVVGVDLDPDRVELARELGADAAEHSDRATEAALSLSDGRGVDAVIIAAASKSDAPVRLAGEVARDRATVVAVGAVDLKLPRREFYQKELDLRLSRSYGPGRYDEEYEVKGRDYPYGYVRWTEQRNIASFLECVAAGTVQPERLVTHRFPIDRAPEAYELIGGDGTERSLAVVLEYPAPIDGDAVTAGVDAAATDSTTSAVAAPAAIPDEVRLGIVGAGNFAGATLLPALEGIDGLRLARIISARGASATNAAKRFSIAAAGGSFEELLADDEINTVAILTRHDQHADQVVAALRAGKHVFVEKPLCLSDDELERITVAWSEAGEPGLMVGFNRRFAPHVRAVKEHLASVDEPLVVHCRVNAGHLPASHWVNDPEVGGGRLLGEACHFVDLLGFLIGQEPVEVYARVLPDRGRYSGDNLAIVIAYADGSVGNLLYVANGHPGAAKEYVEAFGAGTYARLDNYRELVVRRGNERTRKVARWKADKGHEAEWRAWVGSLLAEGTAPVPFRDLVLSTRATLAAQESVATGVPVAVRP